MAQAFGVLLEDKGVAARATFILNPEGWVASVVANALDVGRSAAQMLRLVQAFQSGRLTACERRLGY